MDTVTPLPTPVDWIAIHEKQPEPLHDVLAVWTFDGETSVDVAYRKPNGQWVMTYTELPIEPSLWAPMPAIPEIMACGACSGCVGSCRLERESPAVIQDQREAVA